MIEGGRGPGFPPEALPEARMGDSPGRKELGRNKSVQVRVACSVDNTHPALPDLLYNLIVREHGATHRRGHIQEGLVLMVVGQKGFDFPADQRVFLPYRCEIRFSRGTVELSRL